MCLCLLLIVEKVTLHSSHLKVLLCVLSCLSRNSKVEKDFLQNLQLWACDFM